uniref:tRNA (cytosine(38)-C(5))-methyltransferase-like n=1 Tax=Mastacembelus armatus TaxID=205130 RepID=A0A7N8YMW5_9TELE
LEPFQIFSFHYGIPAQVVAAIDINTTANQVYRHNFPDTPLWNKTIEGISLDDFNKLSFDMILMSPPCQPFTRDLMVQTLKDCGYTFEEIMVSPTSVGIPNSRLRYYLLAKISPENVGIQTNGLPALPKGRYNNCLHLI